MDLRVGTDSFRASVRIDAVLKRNFPHDSDLPVGAFAYREDNGEKVFIRAQCVRAVDLREGDIVDVQMVPNDKYMAGETDCKYFGIYAFREERQDITISLSSDRVYGDRRTHTAKADELLSMGRVWNAVTLTNAVLRKSYSRGSDMDDEEQKILSAIDAHLSKRHKDGTLARVEIRRLPDQERASYVFYTTTPEKLAEALRKAS